MVGGSQYVSIRPSKRLTKASIGLSAGSQGVSYDKAFAETSNGLHKADVIHRRGLWRNFEAVEFATLEGTDWFNNRSLLEHIGQHSARRGRRLMLRLGGRASYCRIT
jgi:transposase InsO family protein